MSPMHVVLASHQQLPAKGYGGPQRVVVALTRGLAALGHRGTLLALAGSRVAEAEVGGRAAPKFHRAAPLAASGPGAPGILEPPRPAHPGAPRARFSGARSSTWGRWRGGRGPRCSRARAAYGPPRSGTSRSVS